jgi:nucleoside-diphosphate-sugar epimerase
VKDGILLTGATGALGSMLLERLCREGRDLICLVRADNEDAARARIETIVGKPDNVTVLRGDVTEPRCGLTDADYKMLAGRFDRVLNCAGCISFHDQNATYLTNVAGMRHVLQMMDVFGIGQILHVSTAYVVGDGDYLSEEGLSNGQCWRNPYEQSKFQGETLLRSWALADSTRRFTIFRPSVLVGCEDGTTSTFEGYYRYIEPMHRTAENLRKRRGNGLPPDVTVEDNGLVRAPFAILIADKHINYIPIDWVADMIVAAMNAPVRNETYNLVHDNPPRMRDCLFWSLDHLKVGGVVVCDTRAAKDIALRAQGQLLNRMQRRIDIIHDAFTPYCTTDPEFQMETAPRNLGAKFRSPPIIDQHFLSRTLNYALEHNWGARKARIDEPA